jgi:serine/threonine protein kinase
MTENGRLCPFAIGCPPYLSPEVIASAPCSPSSPQCDVWAVGVILIELLTLKRAFQCESGDATLVFHDIITFCGHKLEYTTHTDTNGLSSTIQPPPYSLYQQNSFEQDHLHQRHQVRLNDLLLSLSVSRGLKDVIRECLTLLPSQRKTPTQMLHHPYFDEENATLNRTITWVPSAFTDPSSYFCFFLCVCEMLMCDCMMCM